MWMIWSRRKLFVFKLIWQKLHHSFHQTIVHRDGDGFQRGVDVKLIVEPSVLRHLLYRPTLFQMSYELFDAHPFLDAKDVINDRAYFYVFVRRVSLPDPRAFVLHGPEHAGVIAGEYAMEVFVEFTTNHWHAVQPSHPT